MDVIEEEEESYPSVRSDNTEQAVAEIELVHKEQEEQRENEVMVFKNQAPGLLVPDKELDEIERILNETS